ncbi:MAG TPA: APC family permease [Anaerovoracaceae bacterium]|nr:APC family permease [Anaerovoracaceae bacterium]
MKNERQRLKRALGRVEVFALAFGTMVGWGWVMLPAQWIGDAGVLGAVIAFFIGGIMCILVGLTYAELTSAFPLAGGELAFSYRGMGYLGSWITGWTITFAYIGVAAWEGIALSSAFHYMLPLTKVGYLWTVAGFDVYFSWSLIGIVGAVTLTLLNIIGVRPVAVFQMLLVLMMVITGVIFVLGGLAFGRTEYMTPVITNVKGIGMVLLMAPSMYIGFDMVSKSAEEMNIPLGAIAKVLIVSIVAACAWYILMILGNALSAPYYFRQEALVPTADAAAYAFESPIMAKVMIAGGICGIITSWNGFIVGASRIIFAMGRARMLPGFFGWVHPKYQTPVFSILFVGLICCLFPLLGENALIWLIDTAAFGTVIAYLLISVTFLRIRKKEPGLRRRYTIRKGRTVGTCAAVSAAFFLFWYTPFSPSALKWPYEWILILAWILIGILFLAFSRIADRKKQITEAERELLMFGEEYARESVLKS